MQNTQFTEWLQMLELQKVTITATIDPSGRLGAIGGLWPKLLAAAKDSARMGLLRVAVVAQEQSDVPPKLLQPDASPLRVIQAATLQEAVKALYEEHGPRFAVCQWEREQCEKLDIMGRTVPIEKHYQVLPLLREVKKERLLRNQLKPEMKEEIEKRKSYLTRIVRTVRNWGPRRLPHEPGVPEEKEEEIEERNRLPHKSGASEEEEEIRGGIRPVDILGWEEGLREEQVTYEKVTLEQIFENFQSVKEAKSAATSFIILGPPGSGKTTLEQYLAWQAANRNLSIAGRHLIPARVRLREWEAWTVKPVAPESSLPEYLAKQRYKDLMPASSAEQWRDWLQWGEVLLLLDGLDEISGNQSFLKVLETTLSTFKNCPMVLTCRTISFEQHKALCSEFPVFTLAGLEDDQRNAYVHAFPAEYPNRYTPEALIEQLNCTPQMRPLAANPLLLSIICYVVDHPHGITLPARRGEFYTKTVEKLLTRPRRQEITYPGGRRDLPLTRKRRILERVALTLFVGMEQQRQLTFDEDTLVDALTNGVKTEELDQPADVADALLTDLTQNSGILRGDAGQSYFFLHPTVQEFLTAAALAKLMNEDEKGWETEGCKQWAIRKLVEKKAWDPRWQEVITLLTGQLKNPTNLLKLLANKREDDAVRHRLALAAMCLPELSSEVRNSFSEIVDRITTDTFSLCWRQYRRNETVAVVPHLAHALPALGQVNGLVLRKIDRQVFDNHAGISLLDYLAALLCNPNFREQRAAAKAIGDLGSAAVTKDIFVGLVALCCDPDRSVRWGAAEAIRKFGSAAATKDILAGLAALLHDPDIQVQEAAVEMIGKIVNTTEAQERLITYWVAPYRWLDWGTLWDLECSMSLARLMEKYKQIFRRRRIFRKRSWIFVWCGRKYKVRTVEELSELKSEECELLQDL